MEQRLSIITLGVSDLQKAIDFYTKKCGWKKSEYSRKGICFFELNGILLGLYPLDKLADDAGIDHEGYGFQKFTMAYCTRTKEEVDDLFYMFEENDVKIIKLPSQAFWGGYSGYIADPDGNLWEIAYNPFVNFTEDGHLI